MAATVPGSGTLEAAWIDLPRYADVKQAKWPCEVFMRTIGIKDDFDSFIRNACLQSFMDHRCVAYYNLSNHFTQHFIYRADPVAPCVSFKLHYHQCSLSLEEFHEAIHVPYEEDFGEPSTVVLPLVSFYHSLCIGENGDLQRGKLTSIQNPTVHYFAIFIGHCLLPKSNATNTSTLICMCYILL